MAAAAVVVGRRASVQPLAGWLLTGLLLFIAYLTVVYAPGAFMRSQQPEGTDPGGVITLEMGYWTIAVVSVVALLAAFEPQLGRLMGAVAERLQSWLERQSWPSRLAVYAFGGAIAVVWRAPSFLFSFIDMLLAWPTAFLVGAAQQGTTLRYVWGGVVVLGAIAVSLLTPPPMGLIAAIVGIVAIIAIVRRWSWFEADRDTFLVERTTRSDEQRVGFSQDLRDEALVAIVLLFALIPLLLRQIQMATCAMDDCAFRLEGGALPEDLLGQFLAWLGYFGAELAKSVPFVDWSEVFRVANNSPIKPLTTLGAQVAFIMRATLDLMLLAAVVQAVGIASRLRQQNTAFWNNRLPILEPFAESRLLVRRFEPAVEMRAVDEPTVKDFPEYDSRRLRQLILTSDGSVPLEVRRAAVALLARPAKDGKEALLAGTAAGEAKADELEREATERLQRAAMEVTEWFLSEWCKIESNAELRAWGLQIASGIAPDNGPATRNADLTRVRALVSDRRSASPLRAAAARRLGRIGNETADVALLLERLRDPREDVDFRADVAVALAKIAPADADVGNLIEQLPDLCVALSEGADLRAGERLMPTMAVAHALARLNRMSGAAEIAKRFHPSLQEHAHRAALIQIDPMDTKAAQDKEIGPHLDQMVRINPGEGQFPRTFTMGADENDVMPGARPDQRPKVEITMRNAFAFGRFPVTVREYTGFALATGRNKPATANDPSRADTPVVEVSWNDAIEYAAWLERITGERYRLPSEAEWEYACRAGKSMLYWWGDQWDSGMAVQQYSPVNHQGPNPWGIWDLYGHVYEWCVDLWHESHQGRPQDALPWIANTNLVPRSGYLVHRVVRSGSWSHPVNNRLSDLRSSYRNEQKPTHIQTNYGFRLARSLNA